MKRYLLCALYLLFGICEGGTSTPTLSPTPTFTNTPIYTNTLTQTNTPTYTFTPSLTPTGTYSPTPTLTPTPTFTGVWTANLTLTNTPIYTNTLTFSPTNTFTPTNTYTGTLSKTPTLSMTPTNTFTFTPTYTFTSTMTFAPPPPAPVTEVNSVKGFNFGNGQQREGLELLTSSTANKQYGFSTGDYGLGPTSWSPLALDINGALLVDSQPPITSTPTNTATNTPTGSFTPTFTNTPTSTNTFTVTPTPTINGRVVQSVATWVITPNASKIFQLPVTSTNSTLEFTYGTLSGIVTITSQLLSPNVSGGWNSLSANGATGTNFGQVPNSQISQVYLLCNALATPGAGASVTIWTRQWNTCNP